MIAGDVRACEGSQQWLVWHGRRTTGSAMLLWFHWHRRPSTERVVMREPAAGDGGSSKLAMGAPWEASLPAEEETGSELADLWARWRLGASRIHRLATRGGEWRRMQPTHRRSQQWMLPSAQPP